MATVSYQKRYLDLLGASSRSEFENRVVSQLQDALRDCGADVLPIRLAKVARRFGVRPIAELFPGPHDGELHFESPPGEFVIKVCTANPHSSALRARREPRFRFTYAHEFAHRFCYLQTSGEWDRAINIATQHLALDERMQQRVKLRAIEEAICNNIARRVLVPDSCMTTRCDVADWFRKGRGFFTELCSAAIAFSVSIDCVLVRVERAASAATAAGHCALIIGPSSGPVRSRGFRRLRLVSGLFPLLEGKSRRVFYPGMEVEMLGTDAYQLFKSRLLETRSVLSEFEVPVRTSNRDHRTGVMTGWSRRIGPDALFVWGRLTPNLNSYKLVDLKTYHIS